MGDALADRNGTLMSDRKDDEDDDRPSVVHLSHLGLHFVPLLHPVAATASKAAIERGLPHFMTLHGTLHAFCTPLSCLHCQLEPPSRLHFNPT